MTPTNSILHHLKRERQPIHRDRLVRELNLISRFGESGVLTELDLSAAIDELVADGQAVDDGGMISIDRVSVKEKERINAGMLF